MGMLLGLGAALALLVPSPSPSVDVCATSARTVERGLTAFVATIQRATDTDRGVAEAAVREAGAVLVTLGRDLRAEAGQSAGAIGDTLRDLADEFDRQGRALTGVAALRAFDSRRLEALAERMSGLCGGPPR